MRRANERNTSRSRSEAIEGSFDPRFTSGIARTKWGSGECVLHGFEQMTRLEWLDDKMRRAGRENLGHQALVRHGAADQDPRLRIELLDRPNRLQSTELAHHEIHRHEIGPQQLVLLDGFAARLCLTDDVKAPLFEDTSDKLPHVRSVVTDQYRVIGGHKNEVR